MRRKKESVLSFHGNEDGLPKTVRIHRAKYRAISQVLDRNPEILDLVHDDLVMSAALVAVLDEQPWSAPGQTLVIQAPDPIESIDHGF